MVSQGTQQGDKVISQCWKKTIWQVVIITSIWLCERQCLRDNSNNHSRLQQDVSPCMKGFPFLT